MRVPHSLPWSKFMKLTLSACVTASALTSASAMAATKPVKKHRVSAVAKPAPLPLIDASLTQGQPLGVNIDDLVRFAPARVTDAGLLAQVFHNNDARIFDVVRGESLCGIPQRRGSPTDTACGLAHLESAPIISGDLVTGEATYEFALLMQTAAGPAFRKVTITVGGTPRAIETITQNGDIPLSQTNFSIRVGLISRAVAIEDSANGLLLVFPLGVGGIDMGLIGSAHRILTPIFHGAYLTRRKIIGKLGAAQNMPTYYRDKPYMPIVKASVDKRGRVTEHTQDVAFHITILSDDLWANGKGSEFLIRGFDSHGCMRLRLKDLTEFYTIVTEGGADKLPVDVDYFISNPSADGTQGSFSVLNTTQPYPLRKDGYMAPKNYAAPGMPPMVMRKPDPTAPNDPHQLVDLETVYGTPQYTLLDGFDSDDDVALDQFNQLLKEQHNPVVRMKKIISPKEVDVAPVSSADGPAPLSADPAASVPAQF